MMANIYGCEWQQIRVGSGAILVERPRKGEILATSPPSRKHRHHLKQQPETPWGLFSPSDKVKINPGVIQHLLNKTDTIL